MRCQRETVPDVRLAFVGREFQRELADPFRSRGQPTVGDHVLAVDDAEAPASARKARLNPVPYRAYGGDERGGVTRLDLAYSGPMDRHRRSGGGQLSRPDLPSSQ